MTILIAMMVSSATGAYWKAFRVSARCCRCIYWWRCDQGKSDKKDSKRIAYFAQANPELTPWQPEPEEVRTLRQLAKRLETVQKDIHREQNRLEKAQFNRDTQAEHSITHVLALLRREAKRLCLLYTSPSPRDLSTSRMPSSA